MNDLSHLWPTDAERRDAQADLPGYDVGLVGDVFATSEGASLLDAHPIEDLRAAIWRPFDGCGVIVGNLEAAVTDRRVALERKPYLHRMPAEALSLIDRRCVLSLANNHVMDYGPSGLRDTLDALDAAGLRHAGAGMTLDEARSPCLLESNGMRIAVLCAADPRFSPAGEATPGTCPARADLLGEAIRSARHHADLIVVSVHMGLEFVSMPSGRQVALARACLAAGARIVHFHHSHCLSGAAVISDGVVLFGTGNYLRAAGSPSRVATSRKTAAWRVRVDSPGYRVSAISIKPAVLDAQGLPRLLEGSAEIRERERIAALERRLLPPGRRLAGRMAGMLAPDFLRANLRNYTFLIRQRGAAHVMRLVAAGLRAQLGTRPD